MIEETGTVSNVQMHLPHKANGWRWPIAIFLIVLIGFGILVFVVQPLGPSSAWEAADHNRDGLLTREEMSLFITQKPHRTDRLLRHFDGADIDKNGVVTLEESGNYGNEIGSKDPFLRDATQRN